MIHNEEDLDIAISMYNLCEYNQDYSMKSREFLELL